MGCADEVRMKYVFTEEAIVNETDGGQITDVSAI